MGPPPARGAYGLEFLPLALKEWDGLDGSLQDLFLKHIEKRLQQPRMGQPMRGAPDRYKIKLRDVGYRLVYEVRERQVVILVIAVGRRTEAYEAMKRR